MFSIEKNSASIYKQLRIGVLNKDEEKHQIILIYIKCYQKSIQKKDDKKLSFNVSRNKKMNPKAYFLSTNLTTF